MCAGQKHPPREEGNPVSFYRNIVDGEGLLPVRLFRASINLFRRGPRRAGCCATTASPVVE
ncbi:MAG TPA: hypothetical protein VIN01_07380 [Candidatus Dormibacteraeota bacterium]|jgi:hypothetical protein